MSFIIDKATTAAGKVHAEAPTGWKILSVTNEVLPDATLEGWGSYARMQNIIVVQRLFGYWFWKTGITDHSDRADGLECVLA